MWTSLFAAPPRRRAAPPAPPRLVYYTQPPAERVSSLAPLDARRLCKGGEDAGRRRVSRTSQQPQIWMAHMSKNNKRAVISWAFYDWANSAFATTVLAGFFPIFFKNYWSAGADVADSSLRLGMANS